MYMADEITLITLILIAANVIISVRALISRGLFERYGFEVEAILRSREWYRLVTSAFLHVNVPHLLFNMVALYAFGTTIEHVCGRVTFIVIYFGSLLAGSLLALLIHRNHVNYRSVGASGAVSGVIFSFVLLFPRSYLTFFPIYTGLPAWLFAVIYTGVTIYGIRSQAGHVGHEAHLGGAIAGILLTLAFFPHVFFTRYLIVLAIVVPAAVFIAVSTRRPDLMGLPIRYPRSLSRLSLRKIRDRLTESTEKDLRRELDALLDKVSSQGMESLTSNERKRLKSISARLARRRN
jgi:membrane associated rhomboid family serine protease